MQENPYLHACLLQAANQAKARDIACVFGLPPEARVAVGGGQWQVRWPQCGLECGTAVRHSGSAMRSGWRGVHPPWVGGAVMLAAFGIAACVGSIDDPGGSDGADGRDPGDGRTPTEALPAFAPAAPTLHRLTYDEYRNSLRDLLPPGTIVPTDLELDTPLHGFTTIGGSELTISPLGAEQYEEAAIQVAAQTVLDPSRRGAFVGCEITAADEACTRVWIADFGRRAWRRLLTDEEIGVLAGLAGDLGAELGDPWVGAGFAMTAMLQSPHFLFRVEHGEPDPAVPGRLRYTSWEMASRLSYFLWGSTPDDELLQAAARGELVTDEGIRREVLRMLDSPRAREGLTRFFSEFLSLERLETVSKDPETFPQMTPTLRNAMRRELELLFEDVVFERDADFRQILSTDVTYVNSELAELYGLPDPATAELVRTTFPADADRGGLMGRAAVLTLWSHATLTSPTLRGKFIRTNLLCEDVPPPPPGVVTSLEEETAGTAGTLRDRLERHRTDPACAGCHSKMDPLGFALEDYDPIGRFRTTDNGLPVDASSEVDGTPVDGAGELGAALAESTKVAECVARRLYRFATGHLEIETEERAIRELGEAFAENGHSFRQLVLAVALSDGFRTAAVEE